MLFDFGGTLFSYRQLLARVDAALEAALRPLGVEAPLEALRGGYLRAMQQAMARYADRPFYLHKDVFGAARTAFLRELGVEDDGRFADPLSPRSEGAGGDPGVGLVPREDAAETLRALRERDLHVGIVSNVDDDQFRAAWSGFGLEDHVDAITTSEEAGSCKPDAAIYRMALAKAGDPPPESVVFVGDSVPHDVVGANRLGMTSVLIAAAAPTPAGGDERPDHVVQTLGALLEIVRR